jgi:type II secretory pathway pseudopilin PulG
MGSPTFYGFQTQLRGIWKDRSSRRGLILVLISLGIAIVPLLPLTKTWQVERAILRAERGFENALNERRADKLRELLTEDVRVLWQNTKTFEYEHSANGKEEVLAQWKFLLDDPNVRISWRSSDVEAYSDDYGSTFGSYLLAPLTGDRAGKVNFGKQGTWWSRAADGKWRIHQILLMRTGQEKLALGPW